MDAPHQDNFSGKAVPSLSDCSPPPSAELIAAINQLGRTRPVLPTPWGRLVPVLNIPLQDSQGRWVPPFTVIPRQLAYGQGVAGSRREHIMYLVAAYDFDIAGLRPPEAERLSDAEARALSRYRGSGRLLLARACAWPWAAFGPIRKLPHRWWQDERAVAAWREWVLNEVKAA